MKLIENYVRLVIEGVFRLWIGNSVMVFLKFLLGFGYGVIGSQEKKSPNAW